jgi:hypothetical protein
VVDRLLLPPVQRHPASRLGCGLRLPGSERRRPRAAAAKMVRTLEIRHPSQRRCQCPEPHSAREPGAWTGLRSGTSGEFDAVLDPPTNLAASPSYRRPVERSGSRSPWQAAFTDRAVRASRKIRSDRRHRHAESCVGRPQQERYPGFPARLAALEPGGARLGHNSGRVHDGGNCDGHIRRPALALIASSPPLAGVTEGIGPPRIRCDISASLFLFFLQHKKPISK